MAVSDRESLAAALVEFESEIQRTSSASTVTALITAARERLTQLSQRSLRVWYCRRDGSIRSGQEINRCVHWRMFHPDCGWMRLVPDGDGN